MTGRKRIKEGQVEVQPLLKVAGNNSTEGGEEEIRAFLHDLNIQDGPFTITEFTKLKSTLREGKCAGPDCIPS